MDSTNKNLQKNHKPKQKRIFPQGNKQSINQQQNDKNVTLNTDKLDNAMQELIDICQLYNNKLSIYDKDNNRLNDQIYNKEGACNNLISNKLIQNRQSNKQMTIKSDNNLDNKHAEKKESNNTINTYPLADQVIEKLQKKQTELQAQLDEVLKVSKRLESKQKHKLKCIFEDDDDDENSKPKMVDDETDEEDELIEFQKIENDLRLSDINRQLDDIQEELRIRLYKRLLSNTNSSNKKQQNVRQTIRRGSQTDESSPTSSSCSDDQPTTSSPSIINDNIKGKDNVDAKKDRSQINQSETLNSNNLVVHQPPESIENNTNHQLCQNLTPTNSSSGYSSIRSNESLEKNSMYAETNNIYMDISDNNSTTANLSYTNSNASTFSNTPTFHSSILHPNIINKNTSSINSDLERIEEDEEDGQDYYSNSDHFRTIYEEKLSPIIHSNNYLYGNYKNPKSYNQPQFSQTSWMYNANTENSLHNHYNELNEHKTTLPNDSANSFNLENSKAILRPRTSKEEYSKNNRPLTLYMPKPDENIDLIEHVQALGHDLSIISNELKLDATTAQGYLWKSCSNNSKRWLKRYFYFDRTAKLLSYYDNEGQLVNKKKQQSPNNCVLFDEISDVYVDHKLSVLAEKNARSSSAKKRNYVFVLVTTGRKYLLSSKRAEIMRAWIDILFTAAKANDYFHQLTNNNTGSEVEVDDDDDYEEGELNSESLEVA